MAETNIQEAKSLLWLSSMFPFTKIPLDETDKMSNAIHIYCKAGAKKIETMQEEIKMLKEYIDNLERKS
ncbi:cell division protein [[Clostridium] symbiosum]|uniref:cell division protein n=1 Tax=Clostridium symbiosum TaxID=1512 RepID=UPI002109FB7B|nr:cell division protein [[Clostridium] symbiosum]MCQ4833997.1 cell division protein [[Clostridium] symbiosum]